MSDFNPEEYLKRKQQESEFNPEEYLKKKKEVGFFEGLLNVVSAPATLTRSAVTGQFSETLGKALSHDIVRLGEDVPSWKDIFAEKGIPTSYGYEPTIVDRGESGKSIEMMEKMKGYPSPATMLGTAADIAVDPLNLLAGAGAAKATNPLLRRLATMSKTAIGRTLSPYIRATELTKEGIDPRILSKRIYDMNLEGKLGNLDELRQIIGGREQIITKDTSAGRLINKKVDRDTGLVGEYRNDLDSTISQISPSVQKVRRDSIQAQMWLDNLADANNPLSTSTGDTMAIKNEMAGKILKVDNAQYASLEDLLALKRDNANFLNSKDFVNASQLDKNMALEKEVRVEIDRYLKDKIRSMIPEDATVNIRGSEVNARDSFDVSNQMQHQLLQTSQSLETTPLEEFSKSGKIGALLPAVAGAATGAATAAATGIPIYIGGALGAAGGVKALASKSIQPILAKTYGSMSKSPKIMKSLSAISSQIPVELLQNNSRKPQSVEEVALMKLPRSTEEAIQSPELLIEKVKMLDPMSLPLVMNAINEDPEKLPDVMFSLSQQFPHAFDSDKYRRFDGKIPAATMMNYIRDLKDDKSISNTERAKHLNSALTKKQSHYTPQ